MTEAIVHLQGQAEDQQAVLDRVFDLIVFDWDGTAVFDRNSPRSALIAALEDVLSEGAICVVITGTKVENVVDRSIRSLPLRVKRSLFFCVNRGSEVFSFDDQGELVARFRRRATDFESRALDQAALGLRNYVESHGLAAEIISNRLNRRKIDLIPIRRWSDPKKSEFGELFVDVQKRLREAGLKEGISGLMVKTEEMTRRAGLSSPKITTDIKHIEIGLTDKRDSVYWILEHIVRPRRIARRRIIFLGDEFGSVGGIMGSDALMRIPELADAAFVSVGVEPEGVPKWVCSIGGGPVRFVQFLSDQAELRRREGARVIELDRIDPGSSRRDPTWLLEQEGFEPSREREMETLFAIGNGGIGLRGTSDFPVPAAQPDLLIAGVYDKKAEDLPHSELRLLSKRGREGVETEIVPFPSPLHWQLEMDGVPFRVDSPEMLEHKRALDLKTGISRQMHRYRDQQGRRTRVTSSRLASLSDRELIIQQIEILSENYSGEVHLAFPMRAPGFESLYPHLVLTEQTVENGIGLLSYKTHASGVSVSFAQKIFVNGEELGGDRADLDVAPGETIRVIRFVSVFTSRDVSDPRTKAKDRLKECHWSSLGSFVRDHVAKWSDFWESADLKLENAPALTQANRFNLFHLRIAADHDSRVSVPAKALTGRAYEGHVFWDTEIFMFPFYLHTEPEIARFLLRYRYQTLGGARARARKMGCEGACYAWESTLSGKDVTPRSIVIAESEIQIPVHTGAQQIHVTADVAYAVWRYWDATLDEDFLLSYGAEILIETARFWISRAKARDRSLHIENVVGPDEYHYDIHDNAFTNWMARFNLEKAAWSLDWIRHHHPEHLAHLAQRLGLREDERKAWMEASSRIHQPAPDAQGRIEQFDGFFRLKRIRIPEYERARPPVNRLLHQGEVNRLQLLKQADVLMIPFLFPEAFSKKIIQANYRYYEPITDHGSSLSPCVHAALAARAGLRAEALRYWESSLFIDLLNSMANTELGIHAATIGGTWQALVFHMLGVSFGEKGVRYAADSEPALPSGCREVKLKLTYRGKVYPIEVGRKKRVAA